MDEKDNSQNFDKCATVAKWRGRLAASTFTAHRNIFRMFMRWLRENGGEFSDYSPDDFIAYMKDEDRKKGDGFKVLDLVQSFVDQLDWRYNSKVRAYAAVRSFFLHNRAELPRDGGYEMRSNKPPVEGTLTIDEIRDIIMGSNELYQAIYISMFQGALDLSGFEYWNTNGWEDLKEQLRDDPEVVKVKLPGRKRQRNKRPFYTFIGGDSIKAIRNYLPKRPKGGTAIFYNKDGGAVNKKAVKMYWLRHLDRQGLISRAVGRGRKGRGNRYGKNLHEIRDVFRSQWEKSPAKVSVAEFMMGHTVDPLEYNKAYRDESWTRREYMKALPMLQIMSSGRPFGMVDEDELETLRRKMRKFEEEKRQREDEGVVTREDLAEVHRILDEVKSTQKREIRTYERRIEELERENADIKRQLRERDRG